LIVRNLFFSSDLSSLKGPRKLQKESELLSGKKKEKTMLIYGKSALKKAIFSCFEIIPSYVAEE
jgi:hypothetical protein